MARKHGAEIRNIAVAVLMGLPTFSHWFPLWLRMLFVLFAVSLVVWTFVPRQIWRTTMTFGLVLSVVSVGGLAVGSLLHFAAPLFLVEANLDQGNASPSGRPANSFTGTSTGQRGGQTAGTINNYNAPVIHHSHRQTAAIDPPEPVVGPAAAAPTPAAQGHIGSYNTLVGVNPPSSMGDGNTIVGPNRPNGDTIYNKGGTAIGMGACAGSTDVAIGAFALGGRCANLPQKNPKTGDPSKR